MRRLRRRACRRGIRRGLIEAFATIYADFADAIGGRTAFLDGRLPGITDGLRGMRFIDLAVTFQRVAALGGIRGRDAVKTIKGPAIFLAQFMGDAAPFDTLDHLAEWAAGLGYKGVQIRSRTS